ncbi:hypothetical protein DC094_12125 [Pelagibaculum spongiae]|uniref:Sensor protein n=2 Tax=Pelagibaculum spongiae TaxID=2080658 RepID=A0A2V1GTI1_9GAMM|nr:hypothetical protein DC094_12125 [Pelagibaculum spongiae]
MGQTFWAISALSLLALSSMLISLTMAKLSEHDAQAINQSGRLRMQAWNIASEVRSAPQIILNKQYISRYDETLADPALDQHLNDSPEGIAFQEISRRWNVEMKPALVAGTYDKYLSQADDFVQKIDQFVFQLQQRNEQKLDLLELAQAICLALTFLVLISITFLVKRNLLSPISQFMAAARSLSQGKIKQLDDFGDNELGGLAKAFNRMADRVTRSQNELERKVEEQTDSLRTANRALNFLFSASRWLNEQGPGKKVLEGLIEELRDIGKMPHLRLCLSTEKEPHNYDVISTDLKCNQRCNSCNAGGVEIPICEKGRKYGYVRALTDDELSQWQLQLLKSFADMLAATLKLNEQSIQKRQLGVMEERAVIARELHDSLAQSLSYLKIQVTRLKRQKDDPEICEAITGELQQGLNSAYRQLRELLTTFRLTVEETSLEKALEGSVYDLRKQTDIAIEIDYTLRFCPLSANETIHVLQIVREAVSNAVKHSRAKIIRVDCTRQQEKVKIEILDDGIGIPENCQKENHYGMTIMRERSDSLKASFKIGSQPNGGTRVSVAFVPEYIREDNG